MDAMRIYRGGRYFSIVSIVNTIYCFECFHTDGPRVNVAFLSTRLLGKCLDSNHQYKILLTLHKNNNGSTQRQTRRHAEADKGSAQRPTKEHAEAYPGQFHVLSILNVHTGYILSKSTMQFRHTALKLSKYTT